MSHILNKTLAIFNVNNSENSYRERFHPFPYEIKKVQEPLNSQLMQDFTGERTCFYQVGPKNWFMHSSYKDQAENIYNFTPRSDDVWIVTFPRSGTTWTQEIVWLLANNLDFKNAAKIPLVERFPFLEYSCFFHKSIKEEAIQAKKVDTKMCDVINKIASPILNELEATTEKRFIKTHLPFSLLPPDLLKSGCKVIYVARNPKDVGVSFYHLSRLMKSLGYQGDFPKFWDYFTKSLQPWAPYWDHILEGWHRRHEENLLFLFYENLSNNLPESLIQIQEFLGQTYSDSQLEMLKKHVEFDNFKNNKSVNAEIIKEAGLLANNKEDSSFVRRGVNGGWKDYFDNNLNRQADQWIDENLKNCDLRFPDY